LQVDAFILQRPPEALNKDVVETATLAVHRDQGPDPLQPVGPGEGRELRALISVHDLGRAEAMDRLFQRIDTEVRFQRVRDARGQHLAVEPVHNRHQIEEATPHRQVGASGRRYWVRAPQGVRALRKHPSDSDGFGGPGPYVVMQRIDGVRDYTMAGPSGYVASRFQFDVYAATYGASLSLARDLKSVLSGYRSGAVQGVFIDSERNLPAADAGDVSQLFRISIDIIVHHTET